MSNPLIDAIRAISPDRVSLRSLTQEVTYGQLLTTAERVADELGRLGLQKGHRVGLVSHPGEAFVCTLLALVHRGCVPFLVDQRLPPDLVAAMADRYAMPRVLDVSRMGMDGTLEGLFDAAPADPGRVPPTGLAPDTLVCRFTSGSTGMPLALAFSSQCVLAAARAWLMGTSQDEDDVLLCIAPFSNGLGFNAALIPALISGGCIGIPTALLARSSVLLLIERLMATRLVASPPVHEMLALGQGEAPLRPGGLRLAISAAAPLRPGTRQAFRKALGARLTDYYGVAETGPVTFEPEADVDDGLGLALPGAEIAKNPGTGEILVRTGWMSSGYVDRPGAFDERLDASGWFCTKDLGRIERGRLFADGRMDQIVNVGGSKFDPQKVADAAVSHPLARDAHCLVEKTSGGSRLVLCVAPRSLLAEDIVRSHCARILPGYMMPGRIHLVDEIPRNGVGKVVVTSLKNMIP